MSNSTSSYEGPNLIRNCTASNNGDGPSGIYLDANVNVRFENCMVFPRLTFWERLQNIVNACKGEETIYGQSPEVDRWVREADKLRVDLRARLLIVVVGHG